MEKSIADLTAVLKEMQADRVEERKTFDSVCLALEANTAAVKEISGWRPQVESKVDDLRSGLQDLQGKVDRLVLSGKEPHPTDGMSVTYKVFDTEDIDLTKPTTAHLVVPSAEAASGQIRHGSAHHHRGSGYGVVTTLTPPPVKGERSFLDLTTAPFSLGNASNAPPQNWSSLLPQLSFPQFDGTSPKIWKKKCENIFDIYLVPSDMWVKLATMYFTGSAGFWLQAMESKTADGFWFMTVHWKSANITTAIPESLPMNLIEAL